MSVSVETFVCTDGSEAQVVRTNDGRIFSLSRSPIKGLDYEIPASISDMLRTYDPSLRIIDVAKHVEALKENANEIYKMKSWKEILDGKQDLFLSSFTFSNGKTIPVIRGNHRIAYVKIADLKKNSIVLRSYINPVSRSDGQMFDLYGLFDQKSGRNGLILHTDSLIELYGEKYPILRELLEDEQ
jgi:hypothetical protein